MSREGHSSHPVIRLRLLGGVDLVHLETGELRSILAQPKRFALLAYLAVATPRGFHRRDTLLALFWPEADSERARNALKTSLHFLRKALGDGVIVTRGTEEVGLAADRFWCDAVEFQEALDDGRLEDALALYRGDPLPGFNLSGAPEWERWLDGEREGLRGRAVTAAWSLADKARDGSDAAKWARRAAALRPDDEEPLRRLVELLDRIGDRSAAIRAYEDFSRRLAREYGEEPSHRTQLLLEEIRRKRDTEEAAPERIVLTVPGQYGDAAEAREGEAETALPGTPSDTTGPGQPVARSRRPFRVLQVATLVIVLALVGVWWTNRSLIPARPDESDTRVAVLPFAVRGTSEWAYLSEGMVDLLAAKLDGAGRLRTVDPRTLIGLLEVQGGVTDPELGRRFARRFGADLYMLGSVVSQRERLQLSAALYQSEEGPEALVSEATVEGPAEDLPTLVDALAARLLAGRLRGPDARVGQLAARTTSSLAALRAYLRGESNLRSGDNARAAREFEEAVALDSTFALAWYRLSIATAASGWRTGPAAEQAVRYADRLPAHDRYMLRAWRAAWDFRYDEAEELYRSAVSAQPYDIEAWVQLAKVLFHGGPPKGRPAADARPAFQRVLALESDNSTALLYLTRLAARERCLNATDTLTARALEPRGANNRPAYLLAVRGVLLGDQRAMDRAITDLSDVSDFRLWTTAWRLLEDTDASARAQPILRLLTDPIRSDRTRASGYIALAHSEMARGRWTVAQPHLRAAEALDPEMALQARVLFAALPFLAVPRAEVRRVRSMLLDRAAGVPDAPPGPQATPELVRSPRAELRAYQLALLGGRLGNPDEALDYARQLDGLALPPDARMPGSSLADGVRAHVAWLGGAVPDPLAVLSRAWRESSPKPEVFPYVFGPAHPRFLRAEFLRQAGRDEEALQWYQSVVEDYDFGIIYAAPLHLRQAEILERLGRDAEAAEHFQRFIDIWRDADPALQPAVERAQQRLDRL
jgi:DNA-binding SARP family transcriptional activator/TolB-like protein